MMLAVHVFIFVTSQCYGTNLLIANEDTIKSIDTDYGNVRVLLRNMTGVKYLDYDSVNGYLYWLNKESYLTDSIMRAQFFANTSALQPEVILPGCVACSGPAVDPVGGHIYYTQFEPRDVRRSNLNGSNKILLFKHNYPKGVKIDSTNRLLYVIEGNFYPGIDKCPIEGLDHATDCQRLFSRTNSMALDIDIDHIDDRLYWSENRYPGISSSLSNGLDVRSIDNTSNAFGVAVYKDNIYYSVPTTSSVYAISKTSGIITTLYTDPLSKPIYDVMIVDFQLKGI